MFDFNTLSDSSKDMAAMFEAHFRGIPPEPKRCASRSELAFWFSQFANACQRARDVGSAEKAKGN